MQFDDIKTVGDMRRHLAAMLSSWKMTKVNDHYVVFLSPDNARVHVLSIVGHAADDEGKFTVPQFGTAGLPYESLLRGDIYFDSIRHQVWGMEHHGLDDFDSSSDDGSDTPEDTPVFSSGYLYYARLADLAEVARVVNDVVVAALREEGKIDYELGFYSTFNVVKSDTRPSDAATAKAKERNMFDSIKAGDPVKRKPSGYACRVQAVDKAGERLKIEDMHAGRTFWVSRRSFERNWTGYPPSRAATAPGQEAE